MGSSQGSTMSTNVVGIADGSSAQKEVPYIDSLPVYVKELVAGGAAGGFAKTAVAPLERTKILLQVSSLLMRIILLCLFTNTPHLMTVTRKIDLLCGTLRL